MKTSHRWFRVYIETIYDPRVLRLPVAGRWLWIVILALAKQSPDEGKLLVAEGVPMTAPEIGRSAGLGRAQTERLLALMLRQDMLQQEDDTWVVIHWGVRQFVGDDVNARVQRHRQRSQDTNETLQPAQDVTSPDQKQKQRQNRNRTDPPCSPPKGGQVKSSFERVDLSKAQPKARDLWLEVLPALKNGVTTPNYETWLKDTVGYSMKGDRLVVAAPSDFAADWLSTKLRPLCAKAISGLREKLTEIEFVVGQ